MDARKSDVDPSNKRRSLGKTPLCCFERGWPAGEGAIFVLELLLQLEHLAADLAPTALEVFDEFVLLLGKNLPGQEPADAFIDGLCLAVQAGLPVALRGSKRPRGASGHLV